MRVKEYKDRMDTVLQEAIAVAKEEVRYELYMYIKELEDEEFNAEFILQKVKKELNRK